MSPLSSARRQAGQAALLLSLSILVWLSVVGVGVVEIGIADVRRVTYEGRRQEALAAAESALDRATLRLRANLSRIRGVEAGDWMEPGSERWRVCAPCSATDPGDYETFGAPWTRYGPIPDLFASQEPDVQRATASYIARSERPGEALPGWSTLHVIAEGRSADGSALARLRRSYQLRPLLWRIPRAPVEVTAAATITGGFSIVTDDGVPPQSVLPDADALSLLFGPAASDVGALRASARMLDDCTTLGPGSRGLLWIVGECVVSTGTAIGSTETPVVLVVESGTVHVQTPIDLYGILALRSSPAGTTGLVQANGPSALHGALVADRELGVIAEDFSVRYDPVVLQRLLQLAGQLSEVPGSWTDHR
jgi:hypothetical protein